MFLIVFFLLNNVNNLKKGAENEKSYTYEMCCSSNASIFS